MPPKRDIGEVDADEECIDWNSELVTALKAELARRGLPKSGKKSVLVTRLVADDEGRNEDAVPDLMPIAGSAQSSSSFPPASTDPSSTAPYSTAPETSAQATTSPKKRAKRAKKEKSPDLVIDGPLATEMIIHQHTNYATNERRLRPFVPEPDKSFKDKLKRIRKERMFCLNRQMSTDKEGHRCELFDIAGSSGNIYEVSIGRSPSCVCMDARIRGQKCKHINYALIVILKAPVYLQYQLAFLSTELETIFANAPVTRAPVHDHNHEEDESMYNGSRKSIDGDCPICVFEMEPGEEIVWCKAACGQNFHKACFEQWRRSKNGRAVTCVYCRTPWQEDGPPQQPRPAPGSLASLKEAAPKVGHYKNIGHLPMYQASYQEEAEA